MADISPFRLEHAMAEAMKLRAEIGDGDDRLLLDTIEGETDVFEIIDRLTETVIADKLLVERAKERIKRLEAREDRTRATILAMMEALGIAKLERSLATLSVGEGPKKAHVVDAKLIPDVFWRRAIDVPWLLRALKAGPVDGAEISNGPPTLRLHSR